MTRLLAYGPLGLLASSCLTVALAGEPGTTSPPSLDYLLSLGPVGALVWGAFLLGKGVKVTVQAELCSDDRELLRQLVTAITERAK